MKIKSIEKKDNNSTIIEGYTTIELTLGEIITINNSLYEYSKNNDIDMKENEKLRTLCGNLEVAKDILKYGIVDRFTWECMAEDLGYTKE